MFPTGQNPPSRFPSVEEVSEFAMDYRSVVEIITFLMSPEFLVLVVIFLGYCLLKK